MDPVYWSDVDRSGNGRNQTLRLCIRCGPVRRYHGNASVPNTVSMVISITVLETSVLLEWQISEMKQFLPASVITEKYQQQCLACRTKCWEKKMRDSNCQPFQSLNWRIYCELNLVPLQYIFFVVISVFFLSHFPILQKTQIALSMWNFFIGLL